MLSCTTPTTSRPGESIQRIFSKKLKVFSSSLVTAPAPFAEARACSSLGFLFSQEPGCLFGLPLGLITRCTSASAARRKIANENKCCSDKDPKTNSKKIPVYKTNHCDWKRDRALGLDGTGADRRMASVVLLEAPQDRRLRGCYHLLNALVEVNTLPRFSL